MRLPANPALRHVDAGTVSVSRDGEEVVLALGRALVLDATHQVRHQFLLPSIRVEEPHLNKLNVTAVLSILNCA
jgi:hypothetical protein